MSLCSDSPERHIYFSSGVDDVSYLFLSKFDRFYSKYISNTIVNSQSINGLDGDSMDVSHDKSFSKSFYKFVFGEILDSSASITIDFYIDSVLNTSCSLYSVDTDNKNLYMTQFIHEPELFNLTSYQIHKLHSSSLSEINNYWLNDV